MDKSSGLSISLYQWPPGTGTESIFPRCVVFQRICNLAGINAQIHSVTVPEPGDDFDQKLRQRLINIPLMEVNGVRYTDSREIIEFLLTVADFEGLNNLRRLDVGYSLITQEWANLVFINSLVYSRWAREENFLRFTSHVNWGKLQGLHLSLTKLRAILLSYLERTLFTFSSEGDFEKHLADQMLSLEIKLMGQKYFEPLADAPTLTDLYMFMVVQGFYSDDLEESVWIRNNYPNVSAWYKRVDRATQKRTQGIFKE